MAGRSSASEHSISPGVHAVRPAASHIELLRWITLLPGVFLVSFSLGVLAGGAVACVLRRPAPIVMEFLIPVIRGWAGALFTYYWAPDRKWSAARAIGLLLGFCQLAHLLFWVMGAGWAALRLYWLSSFVVGLAIAAAPWLLQQVIVSREKERGPAHDQERAGAQTPELGFLPGVAATPTLADNSRAPSSPAPGWEAFRWVALLPAALAVYYVALCAAFLSMSVEKVADEQMWLRIVFSHAVAGWAALLCSAWIAPARKRSVAYVGYLVFLILSLPLSGRTLTAHGLDTAGAMMGLWLIVAAAVAPAPWVVQRIWGQARRRTSQDHL